MSLTVKNEVLKEFTKKLIEKQTGKRFGIRAIMRMYRDAVAQGEDKVNLLIIADYRKGTTNRYSSISGYEFNEREDILCIANEFIRQGARAKTFMSQMEIAGLRRYLQSDQAKTDIIEMINESEAVKKLLNNLKDREFDFTTGQNEDGEYCITINIAM